MNQPGNSYEGGQPISGWQSDRNQPIQSAGSTPDPASQEPYGAGQTPTDNQGYQEEPGTYPSYPNESGCQEQPSPVLPDPVQPAYRGQQIPGAPQPGAAWPTYQPTPVQPAYQGQPYGRPAGYPQNAYQEPLYPQPGARPQIPQTPPSGPGTPTRANHQSTHPGMVSTSSMPASGSSSSMRPSPGAHPEGNTGGPV